MDKTASYCLVVICAFIAIVVTYGMWREVSKDRVDPYVQAAEVLSGQP